MNLITQRTLLDFENSKLKIIDNLQIIPAKKFKRSNFSSAFYLLPKEKRIAISNFYALCSYLDDIVDEEILLNNYEKTKQLDGNIKDIRNIKAERLNFWKKELSNIYENKNSSLQPLKELINRFNIPIDYFNVLIEGIGKDVYKTSYETFDELLGYFFGVAGIVGIICLHIFDENYYKKENNNLKNYAINLGNALQLTNILRDIKIDADRGYFYLPNEDLRKFNYSHQDILDSNYNENFIKLMKFQYDRAINFYKNADNLIQNEDKNLLKASEAMKRIYFKLLNKIKSKNFNIFNKRISLSKIEKIYELLK